MQAWGNNQSKFAIRRSDAAPGKSAIVGLLCAALGVSRLEAADGWLERLSALRMGVRIDRPGIRWWDYHTVGAGMQMRIAEGEGKTKPGAMLTRREYLCDASFLVALQGEAELISELETALKMPKWTLYLGRKCCPPSRPMLEQPCGDFPNLLDALRDIPWKKRNKRDDVPAMVECLLDWEPTAEQPEAPDDALVCYDVPLTFDPPSHRPRFVIRRQLSVGDRAELSIAPKPAQSRVPPPSRPRADYTNSEYKKVRQERLCMDHQLCVFCKAPATTVQHVTYRHAGGNERLDELRSLCRLCHNAVTMIEYGLGMGLDRINPEESQWRDRIIQKRQEIIRFRSLETRRRKLEAKDVE
jgi:CRISPR system Cascade subunit CasD